MLFHEFELFYEKRPPAMNAERSQGHWSQRQALTQEWRQAFALAAQPIRKRAGKAFAYLTIEVFVEHKHPPAQDPAACFPAFKAALDGMVDARLVPDDVGTYVREVTFYPPEVTGRDRLTLRVKGWPA